MRMPNKILLRCRCGSGRDGDGKRTVHRQTVRTSARHVGELLSLPLGRNDYRSRQCALFLESRLELLSYYLSCSRTAAAGRNDGYSCNDGHKDGCTIKNWRTVLVGHERFRLVGCIGADPAA